ncbi:dienelactone hydrolase family protein [Paenibacillus glacialis]|uniref:Dienelactone hydrolase domain-containing protein n=1 Tax=Paenibacillus glacialis TaxID=494026 RepID=A0A168HPB5_9BACL|nr:dienelactone hydrolase family protein [Paenibacillus glacialis]OAB38388.1 hypothetical protein PGLA_20040 [Paenibacillus glacialis]
MNLDSPLRSLVIILHEIYGVNDHIQCISEVMINEGFDVLTPNLLNRDSFSYHEEDAAYHYFMNEVGFNKSIDEVNRIVQENREKYEQIFIIGFSIGATMAWISSEYEVDGVIGYYGSRIRNHVEIEPRCPNLLFFARNEKSFDVSDLEMKLKTKKNTVIEIIEAEHGFMNPFHTTHKPKEYRDCIEVSIDFLKRIEKG